MLRKLFKTAATIAAMTMLPLSAVAATPAAPASMRAGAALQEANGQMEELSQYLVPAIIVIALGLGLYFVLEDDEEDLPVSA